MWDYFLVMAYNDATMIMRSPAISLLAAELNSGESHGSVDAWRCLRRCRWPGRHYVLTRPSCKTVAGPKMATNLILQSANRRTLSTQARWCIYRISGPPAWTCLHGSFAIFPLISLYAKRLRLIREGMSGGIRNL